MQHYISLLQYTGCACELRAKTIVWSVFETVREFACLMWVQFYVKEFL